MCGISKTVERLSVAANVLAKKAQAEKWFRFTEVNIEVLPELWPKIAEMPSMFCNREIPKETTSLAMIDHIKRT